MSNLNGFNGIARYYDTLKRLVFGSAIDDSQRTFLTSLPPGGKLLVLGGGSGEILRPVFEANTDCRVWFVEASSAMLDRAIANVPAGKRDRICFIHGTEAAVPSDIVFDGVITNFFLDLFSTADLRSVCGSLKDKLSAGGIWLISDFVDDGKWWQRFLLQIMYAFFSVTCHISNRRLPAWEDVMESAGFEMRASKSFYAEFIKSCIYARRHAY